MKQVNKWFIVLQWSPATQLFRSMHEANDREEAVTWLTEYIADEWKRTKRQRASEYRIVEVHHELEVPEMEFTATVMRLNREEETRPVTATKVDLVEALGTHDLDLITPPPGFHGRRRRIWFKLNCSTIPTNWWDEKAAAPRKLSTIKTRADLEETIGSIEKAIQDMKLGVSERGDQHGVGEGIREPDLDYSDG